MKIDYIQHAECEGCPYEEAELVKEEIYSDGEKYFVSIFVRCENYFVCERIKKISRRYPPLIMIFKRGSGDRWVAFIFPLSNTQGIFWKGGGTLWREKARHTQN